MSQMTDLNTILPDYLFEVSWEADAAASEVSMSL